MAMHYVTMCFPPQLPVIMHASLNRHLSSRHHLSAARLMEPAPVVNSSLVDEPAIRQPGFDLSRRHWVLLNRFRTNQGHCASCRSGAL